MKSEALNRGSEEIELKLALPMSDPSSLAQQLARTPVLRRRKATKLQLHNVYYDTPEQVLRQQRVALRVRRVSSGGLPQCLQTLKVGGTSDSALSQRGEWELPVPDAALSLHALKATPWERIDPDGTVFGALRPCFVTTFERTTWLLRRRDRSVVEVALDLGQIVAGDKSAAICELELELLAGQPTALFDVAQQIARSIAVLPLNLSKAQRGYALAQDCLDLPLHAQPPLLTSHLPLSEAARRALREMWGQFTTNLNALRSSDNPEVVHQARVGWRRFRSAGRLFKPAFSGEALPPWRALHALVSLLGELRDLDVARTDTLARLADAYTGGDAGRAQAWQSATEALLYAADLQRNAVRDAVEEAEVGATLLGITRWLEGLSVQPEPGDAMLEPAVSLRRWAKRRTTRLHEQLLAALKDTGSPEHQHRTRILAKRLRYGIEALHPLLPRRRTQRWYQQAIDVQTRIGTSRDVMQASVLMVRLGADRGIVEFLRGVAVGQAGQK